MKRINVQKNFLAAFLAAFLLVSVFSGPGPVLAQEKSAADTNMDILRNKLKADKKLLVAANMSLTDAEAKGFWPLYDEYQKELEALNVRVKNTIANYAEAYNADTLTDETAQKLVDETIAIGLAEAQMHKAFATKLAEVLPGKQVARYLQLENKIRAVLRYELAAEIPLVE